MTLLKSIIFSFKKIFKKSKRSLGKVVFPKVKKPKRTGRRSNTFKRSSRHKIRRRKQKISPRRRVKKKKSFPIKKILRSKPTSRIKTKRIQKSSKIVSTVAASRNPPSPQLKTHQLANVKNFKTQIPHVFIGEITHFFSRISVCVIKIRKDQIKYGDSLLIKGGITNFVQKVQSLQIESVDVKVARKGHLVGLQVDRPARVGDKVFKILKFQ